MKERPHPNGHAHFITSSTYHRMRLFDSERFKGHWVETLGKLRGELGFRVLGYVLMPEHFHLLIWPVEPGESSKISGRLKQRTAQYIVKNLKTCPNSTWCRRMVQGITLPESVHDESTYRVWQRRCYDFDVWSETKRLEKLEYMHGNPVKRRLVKSPADWLWSSWRFYHLKDDSILSIVRLP